MIITDQSISGIIEIYSLTIQCRCGLGRIAYGMSSLQLFRKIRFGPGGLAFSPACPDPFEPRNRDHSVSCDRNGKKVNERNDPTDISIIKRYQVNYFMEQKETGRDPESLPVQDFPLHRSVEEMQRGFVSLFGFDEFTATHKLS
jgi:hypothetical protein